MMVGLVFAALCAIGHSGTSMCCQVSADSNSRSFSFCSATLCLWAVAQPSASTSGSPVAGLRLVRFADHLLKFFDLCGVESLESFRFLGFGFSLTIDSRRR